MLKLLHDETSNKHLIQLVRVTLSDYFIFPIDFIIRKISF
jgi:hypothetical protein